MKKNTELMALSSVLFVLLGVAAFIWIRSESVEKKEIRAVLYRYVNSPEGLRIRDVPDINGEIIGVLKNKEKVGVIGTDFHVVTIDGIKHKWVHVVTENGLEGYSFGGYLEADLENVELIQSLEGMYVRNTGYIDDYTDKTLEIHHIGENKFSIKSKLGVFPSDWTLSLSSIKEKNGLIYQQRFEYNATEHLDHSLQLIDGKIFLVIDDDYMHTIAKETIELEKNLVLSGKYEVSATEETLSQYYVMFGNLKKRVGDVVETNLGTAFSLFDAGNYIKGANPDFPYKTYLFNPKTNELTLLCETDGWGVGGPGHVKTVIDGDFAIRYGKSGTPLYVDVYNYVKKENVISGIYESYNASEKTITVKALEPLSEGDEELVADDFEDFDRESLVSFYTWKKCYVYTCNYMTGEKQLLRGEYAIVSYE